MLSQLSQNSREIGNLILFSLLLVCYTNTKPTTGGKSMSDDEKWGLSREEIEKRLRDLNQKKKAAGPTRGGRSSGQGVKLLYIRDYLYAEATKEHPKKAKEIQTFLASKNIEAHPTTIALSSI